jgi:Uma2 family endonuclease
MATPIVTITLAEFEAFSAQHPDRRFELVHGEIIEKVPTEEHGAIVAKLIAVLYTFVAQFKLGRVTTETRHRSPTDPTNSRMPDIAFTRRERLKTLVTQGAVLHMPDLAIEVKSPDDTYKQMREKATYYLQQGAALVWLIYPEKQLVEVYTETTQDILDENDTLTGGAVLPNFTLAVREIFEVE